jgi:hypothetical protein
MSHAASRAEIVWLCDGSATSRRNTVFHEYHYAPFSFAAGAELHSGGPSYILLPAAVGVNYGLIDKKVPANSLSPLPLPTVTYSSFVAPLDEFPPPKAIPQRLLRTT